MGEERRDGRRAVLGGIGRRETPVPSVGLWRKRRPYVPIFAFIACSALPQPMLTSSLCALRQPMMRPPPGCTPGQSRSKSALQYFIAAAETRAASDNVEAIAK